MQHALDVGINEDDPMMERALNSMIDAPKEVVEKKVEAKHRSEASTNREYAIQNEVKIKTKNINKQRKSKQNPHA